MKILRKAKPASHLVEKRLFYKFINLKQKREIERLAINLKGKKILHLNATAAGGGVAELLSSLVPYLKSLGIKNDWYVIDPKKAGGRFFDFTNKLHNALQGAPIKLNAKQWQTYKKVNKKIAADINSLKKYDLIVINDSQPLFSGACLPKSRPKIFFSHNDTSTPHKGVRLKVLPMIEKYDRVVFSNKDFVNGNLDKNKVRIIPPAIDPLAPKQKIVSQQKAKRYLKKYGVSAARPFIAQVSRFDVWKNPLGVIEAFRLAQEIIPNLQLALVGFSEADDNPEASKIYADVFAIAKNDYPNVLLFFDAKKIKGVAEFTAMAQNAADIVIQNSTREGFGLTVTEAMWKEKAVIGGPAAGIKRQIKNGQTGYIVKTPRELAEKIVFLLKNKEVRIKIGRAAKKSVIKNFLFPRLVTDHLRLYNELL